MSFRDLLGVVQVCFALSGGALADESPHFSLFLNSPGIKRAGYAIYISDSRKYDIIFGKPNSYPEFTNFEEIYQKNSVTISQQQWNELLDLEKEAASVSEKKEEGVAWDAWRILLYVNGKKKLSAYLDLIKEQPRALQQLVSYILSLSPAEIDYNSWHTIDDIHYLKTADFSKYLGKTVGLLLPDLPHNTMERIGLDEPPGYLVAVRYVFDQKYEAVITAHELKYTKRFNKNKKWNLDAFSKEKITGITLRWLGREPLNIPFKRTFGQSYDESRK